MMEQYNDRKYRDGIRSIWQNDIKIETVRGGDDTQ